MPKTLRKTARRVTHVCPTHDRIGESSVTYQLEQVTCGKSRCRSCPHGPYWYAYWTSGGRTRSLYIGKLLRPAAEVAIARVQRARRKRSGAKKRSSEAKELHT